LLIQSDVCAGRGGSTRHLHHRHTLKAYVIQHKQGGLGKGVRWGNPVRFIGSNPIKVCLWWGWHRIDCKAEVRVDWLVGRI